jgi:two-component system chemotaxis response regulator CheB
VIGVVLTGTLDDGTAGLQTVKQRGGLAVAQDPEDALFASMPRCAIEAVAVDHIVPLAEMGPTLVRLAHQPAPKESEAPMPPGLEADTEIAEFDMDAIEGDRQGKPSAYACPDCHGTLWEVQEDDLLRFRCRVGHAFSPESLLAAQSDSLEDALWTALRALEESAALADRLRERASGRGHRLAASRFGQQAADARGRAAIIRRALLGGQIIAASGPPGLEENAFTLSPPNALGGETL